MDNKDLKEALEAIKDLRAALHLARHDPVGFTDADEVKVMAETDMLLVKHGERDDLMDDNGE